MKILYTIYVWIVLTATVLAWCSLLAIMLIFDRGKYSYPFMARTWAGMVVFLTGVKVEISGLDKIPKGPAVYMANHQSYFDVISMGAFVPVAPRYVAKRVLTYIPVFGQILYLTGHIIIDRDDPRQAFGALDRAAEKIKRGTSIYVFPEGTRSKDHKLGQFKKGGFVLAIKAGVPIVPISVTGTQSMMPKGKFSFKRPKLVRIAISDPVDGTSSQLDQRDRLMSETRKAMIRGFAPDTPEWKMNCADLEDPPAPNAA
jgi:1-acyl-sn-glycerol-3-phosphate acyltransferase